MTAALIKHGAVVDAPDRFGVTLALGVLEGARPVVHLLPERLQTLFGKRPKASSRATLRSTSPSGPTRKSPVRARR